MVSSIFLVAALCVLSLYSANALSLRDRPNKQVKLESFVWKDCGPSSDPAQIQSVTVTPDPIKLPGNITVSTAFTLSKDSPTDISLVLVLKKKIAGFWVKVPCVDGVGSCTYDSICGDWAKVCPQYFPDSGLPCTCPFPGKAYSVSNAVIPVTESIPGIASGDYQITASLNSATAGEIVCLYVEATLG